MILKGAFLATVCTALLMSGGASAADAYRPDQLLGLDLSKAVLSPKPLGPASEFAPVAVEARTDGATERAAEAPAEPRITMHQCEARRRVAPPATG